ncbi:MAG: hypothetical protein CM15mP55_2580 [Hyphomicrobiales bacterium]|nr:MAG: hypothetical protein CM15mP55_2580 [Hyphomicrobiales bacterium]
MRCVNPRLWLGRALFSQFRSGSPTQACDASSDIKASEGATFKQYRAHALIIGLAQMLALIPGASRAGVTIMAGLYLGFDRTQAARFSMLLAMPVIGAFALVGLVDLVQAGALEALGMALVAGLLRRYSPLRPFMCF